jgi:ribosomal protein S18 acetylase RimI-like enzyme
MATEQATGERSALEGLTLRRATAADNDRIAEIIAGDPAQETMGIVQDEAQARAFGMGLALLPNSPQGWQHSLVGEIDGEVIAVLQSGIDAIDFGLTPGLLWLALSAFGGRFFTVLGRYRARQRVDIPHPKGSYYISELHVDPRLRNRGIGGAALRHAEDEARRLGATVMSLNTTTINPARRLYERHGFRVVETRTDSQYEQYTGIAGRLLMVKELS